MSQSKPPRLGFQHHHLDHANGQNYWKLYAYNEDTPNWEVVGYLDYSEFQGKFYIDMVFVNKNMRRQGIGTALMRELERKASEEGVEIVHGMQTSDGVALNQSLSAEWVRDNCRLAAARKKTPSLVVEHPSNEMDEDYSQQRAEAYFEIGHQDDEAEAQAKPNMLWILSGKDILAVPESDEDGNNVRTHGTVWGHDRADKTWKGRYDSRTGHVSVVSPNKFSSPPEWLIDLVRRKFRPTKIMAF